MYGLCLTFDIICHGECIILSLFNRVVPDAQFKRELRVRVLGNDHMAEVELRTPSRLQGRLLLCKLHLAIPVSCVVPFSLILKFPFYPKLHLFLEGDGRAVKLAQLDFLRAIPPK